MEKAPRLQAEAPIPRKTRSSAFASGQSKIEEDWFETDRAGLLVGVGILALRLVVR